MKFPRLLLVVAVLRVFPGHAENVSSATPNDLFAAPVRGFVSERPAASWEQGILSGNGTMGALVMGNPFDETLYLSHASLYLPHPDGGHFEMASRLEEIRKLCLAGDYRAAGGQITAARTDASYNVQRDPFTGAFALHIKQPESKVARYQRAVDFTTAETSVAVVDETGSFRRSAFVSRPGDVIVVRLAGGGKQSADFSFAALPPANDKEQRVIAASLKSSEQGVKDGFLYFRTLFAQQNAFNPNMGYEGVGKVVAKGGTRTDTPTGVSITDADEVLLLVKIQPLLKTGNTVTNFAALRQTLDGFAPDYATLLAAQAKAQSDLMGRVSLSLNAPAADRAKSSEQLNADSEPLDAPLAKIERAFDAGRYNIICSTGFNPPNLQGLWSATWQAPWSGSMTTNGNLPCAVSFLLMGNTPELMQSYFHYYDDRLPGFRENAKVLFGTRGFHVPAQLTVSPRETNFTPDFPHCFWHAGAAWACQFYYDNFLYTGDEKFLSERAYPMMKEAAAFYEDFLTVKDANGKLVFVPSFSPENTPGGSGTAPTSVNATMEFAAAKQLFSHAISAAKHLGRDADLQAKWADMIAKMPAYEVGPDGSFREWLWPGEAEHNAHRHASNLYALYDETPAEIVGNPAFVSAVEHSIAERLKFFFGRSNVMAFGLVQNGLAAEHVGNAKLAQQVINFLAKGYWSAGMASFHNKGALFNMDISGGFPYLCASSLVYADPGQVRFFPARPAQWEHGSLKGVRLRGGIVVRELTWDGPRGKAVLVSDTDQTIKVESPGSEPKSWALRAGTPTSLDL